MTSTLEFRALGPLEVLLEGEQIDLDPHKQRALLALLVVNANRVVSKDRIADALWGEDAAGKENATWAYISRLRSVLDPGRGGRGERSALITRKPGYMLHVVSEQVDILRFQEALDAARDVITDDAEQAVTLLDEAIGLCVATLWPISPMSPSPVA